MLLHEFVLAKIEEERIDRDRDAAGAFLYTRLKKGVERYPKSKSDGAARFTLPESWFADDVEWARFRSRCKAVIWLNNNRSKGGALPSYVEEAIATTLGRMRPSVSADFSLILRPTRADGSPALAVVSGDGAWEDIDVFWQCVFTSILAPNAIRQVGRCLRCGKVIETEAGRPSKRRYCEACKSAVWRDEHQEQHRKYQREYQRDARRAKRKKADEKK